MKRRKFHAGSNLHVFSARARVRARPQLRLRVVVRFSRLADNYRTWNTRQTQHDIVYTVLLHEIPRRAIIYSPLNHSASAYGRSVGARRSLRVGADRESASRGNRWNRVPASCSPERERANAGPSSTWACKTTRASSTRVYTQHDRDSIAFHDWEIRNPHRVQSSPCSGRHLPRRERERADSSNKISVPYASPRLLFDELHAQTYSSGCFPFDGTAFVLEFDDLSSIPGWNVCLCRNSLWIYYVHFGILLQRETRLSWLYVGQIWNEFENKSILVKVFELLWGFLMDILYVLSSIL